MRLRLKSPLEGRDKWEMDLYNIKEVVVIELQGTVFGIMDIDTWH